MTKIITEERKILESPDNHTTPHGIVGQMGLAVLKGRWFAKTIQHAKKTENRNRFFAEAYKSLGSSFKQPALHQLLYAAFFHGCANELGLNKCKGLVRQANSHKAAIYSLHQLMVAYWLISSKTSTQFEQRLLPHMDGMAQEEWVHTCIGARAAIKVAASFHQAGFTVIFPRAFEDMTFKIDLIALLPDDPLHGLCMQIKSAGCGPHSCAILSRDLSAKQALHQSQEDIAFAERIQQMRKNFPQNKLTPVKIDVGKNAMELPGKDLNPELSDCPACILRDLE